MLTKGGAPALHNLAVRSTAMQAAIGETAGSGCADPLMGPDPENDRGLGHGVGSFRAQGLWTGMSVWRG